MSDGYITDGGGFAYHRETNPLFQRFCLLASGFAAPASTAASVHYELGFGQGVGINAHAAAQLAQFLGSDPSSPRVAFARTLAEVSGCDVRLLDDDLEQLLTRQDLPQCDSISVHGLWSRASVADRQRIVEFIQRHLKPGGVLYIQYDTMPGLAHEVALRKAMCLYNQLGPGTQGGSAQRVRAALDYVRQVCDVAPSIYSESPLIALRIAELEKADPAQVEHECFNPHWQPTFFSDLCQALGRSRLDWACSAMPATTIAALQIAPEDRAILNATSHPVARQQMLDFFTNAASRADLFVRGASPLSSVGQRRALMDMRFVLVKPFAHIPKALGLGENQDISDPALVAWLEYLAADALAPKSARGLLDGVDEQTWIDHMLMLLVLVGAGVVAPAQSEAEVDAVAERCAALNLHLMEAALSSRDITALVSPVLGGALAGINRTQQLLLLARTRLGTHDSNGQPLTPEHWGVYAAQLLHEQGEHLLGDDGQPLPVEQHAQMLAVQAQLFALETLPVLQALQIA